LLDTLVKEQLLENFAIYQDQKTGYLYPTTDRNKAKAYFKVNDTELDTMYLNEIDQKGAARDLFSQGQEIAKRAKEWWGENLKDFEDANNFPPLYKITFKDGPEGGNLYLPSTIKAAFHDAALEQDLANLEPGQSITYGNRMKISITSLSVNEAWDEMRPRNAEREKVHAIVEEERRRQIENKKVGMDNHGSVYSYDSIPEGITEVTDEKDKRSFIEQEIQLRLKDTKVYKDRHGRIYAGSPRMAETFFNIKDINALVGDTGNSLGLKEVPETRWAVELPELQEQRQADAQLRASMGKDQIFGYRSISGDKGALAPTRREVAEKLLPAERFKVFGKNIENIEERLEKDVSLRPMTSVEARDWYIEERYEMICDQSGNPAELKDLKSEKGIQWLDDREKQRTDNINGDHKFVYGRGIDSKEDVRGFIVRYSDNSEKFYPADGFSTLIKDLRSSQTPTQKILQAPNIARLERNKPKVSDEPYKLSDENGNAIEVRRTGLEYTEGRMRIEYQNKLYKNIYAKDIDMGKDVYGYRVTINDGAQKLGAASSLEEIAERLIKEQDLNIPRKALGTRLGNLADGKSPVGGIPIEDKSGKEIKIEIEYVGLKQEEKLLRLDAIIEQQVTSIDSLQKEMYNEAPKPGAKPEDRCVYLVGNVPYTHERFLQWAAARKGREGMPKTLAVGDPSYKYTTKPDVTYEIKRLGLEQTGQKLEEAREKIYRRLEYFLGLPKTNKKYHTYRIVQEVDDGKGNRIRKDSTIEIADNTLSLADHIHDTYFKGKNIDLDGDLDANLAGIAVGGIANYNSIDGSMRIKVERIAENEACAELDKEERKHIKEIADLQKQLGKPSNEICGGKDVSRWKDRIFPYKIILEGQAPVLQVAESPSEMAMSLAARGIKDKRGIAKMEEELSNIYDRNNTAENYEFSANIIGKDEKQIEVKYIVKKVEISEIKAKMEQDIINTKNEIIKCLPLYEQANPWNYNKIYAGKPKYWRDVCFAEVDGKLRFGESLKAIRSEFPGKEYKTDISPYAALQKLERLTKDHGARITLMKHVYDEQRERVKQAFPGEDFDKEVGYRFKFLSAEEHYDFEFKGKRYIGASPTEAATFFGIKPEKLKELAALSEVDKDGYFIGSSSEIKRRQVDSDTVEVVLAANRDQWAIDPIHMFKDAAGKVWFTDEEHLDDLPEFKDKSMVRISEKGIDIRNVVNPNPLAMPQIKVDWTDPDKSDKKDAPASKDSDNQDIEQSIVSQPNFPFLDQWSPLIPAEA
jgi:hypothetical protein